MSRLLSLSIIFFLCATQLQAQWFKKPVLTGMYLQWGYNREWYSKSDIHFSNGSAHDFTIHKAVAEDKPDFDAIASAPFQITIPQYNFRIGFYLNPEHTHAIEINFDHAKYVMKDYQKARITGQINGEAIDRDTIIDPQFIHFEHTDGANFYHINYVGQYAFLHNKKNKKTILSTVYKAGAGIVVPRTDVTFMGKELNNKFHVAGYIFSAEAGFRFYPLRNLFLELTGKTGYVNYVNALTIEGGKASHHFVYGEVIGLIGYDINFRKYRKKSVN